jgi:phage FluMu gp28-like protein
MPEPKLNKYFLPYQIEAILHEDRLWAWEKSIRIGATYCLGFRAVRRRLLGKGDYLHTSVSLPAALEFIQECQKWNEIFGVAALSLGEIDWEDSIEGKAYQIKYDNGQRIIAFSSNPKAIRSFGGEVGVDELAFHKDPREMLKSAGGRAMWGYPVSLWSSHNGAESEWNRFLTEERARGPKSRWRLMTTTLPDAIEAGLVDKINQVQGTSFSREEFVEQTIALVGGMEAYEEECLCLPRKSGSAAIKWQFIEGAREDYEIFRLDLDGDNAVDLDSAAGLLFDDLRKAGRSALGYDVARTGDLSAMWVNRRDGARWRLSGLITMRNRKFGLQREIAARFMERVPAMLGGGDATGLGMQVCEELAERFGPARFAGMNFSAMKSEIGTKLVRVFEDGRQAIPRGDRHADIAADLAGIRTEPTASGRTRFYETRNPYNKASHCDIAWAAGLAVTVGDDEAQIGAISG